MEVLRDLVRGKHQWQSQTDRLYLGQESNLRNCGDEMGGNGIVLTVCIAESLNICDEYLILRRKHCGCITANHVFFLYTRGASSNPLTGLLVNRSSN